MKREDQLGTRVGVQDDFSLPALSSRAPGGSGGHTEEIVKLRTENVRLQRLVAELLVENQQLRQRYCGSRADRLSMDVETGRSEN
jgi:hypothetical protein